MNIKIIDNFLPKENFLIIKETVLSNDFPWYFQDFKVYKNDGNFQFLHVFFHFNKINSNYFNLIEPFLPLLNVKSIVRIKLNLTIKEKKIKKFKFHADTNFNCNTAIFYLNTNNGKTIFKNGKEVESVENRIIIFPSNLEHTGTTHTDTPYRMVLNLNYF
jgi:hypothetical protein